MDTMRWTPDEKFERLGSQAGLVSILVSVFGSEQLELRESRDLGDSAARRRSPLESAK